MIQLRVHTCGAAEGLYSPDDRDISDFMLSSMLLSSAACGRIKDVRQTLSCSTAGAARVWPTAPGSNAVRAPLPGKHTKIRRPHTLRTSTEARQS
jgi:hypothetical protein